MRPAAGRLLRYTLVVLALMALCGYANANAPDRYVFDDDEWSTGQYTPEYNESRYNVLFDAHSHTIHSDGLLDPLASIRWHLANGYNAMAVTDHNTLDGALEAREVARERFNDSMKVIVGMEWTTSRVHLNLLGVGDRFVDHFSKLDPDDVPDDPSDDDIKVVILETHDRGGLVVVNHYQRSVYKYGADAPSREVLLDWGVDHFEVINEKSANAYPMLDEETRRFSGANGLGQVTGTDLHDPSDFQVHGWTMMNSTSFTEEGIFRELRERRTGILYNSTGSPVHDKKTETLSYQVLGPVISAGSALERYVEWPSVDVMAIAIMFGYIYGAFLLLEVVRFLKERSAGRGWKGLGAPTPARRPEPLAGVLILGCNGER